MIEKNTVLVLGAGASCPYGLPLGSELREGILELTWAKIERAVCSQLEFPESRHDKRAEFNEFQSAFRMAGSLSIDAFLGCRPDLMEIGKVAIAAYLLPKESYEALFPVKLHRDNWYGYFADRLGSDPAALLDNKVSIITFNYDRSLEAYLLSRWQQLHRMTWAEAYCLLSKLRIVHVYGELGRLSQGHGSGVPYGGGQQPHLHVKEAAQGLKLINEKERDTDSQEFVKARQWISEAETICFLGFAFDETNVKHLGGSEIAAGGAPDGRPRYFAASAYLTTELQREKISRLTSLPTNRLNPQFLYDDTSLTTLRKSLILER